MCSRAAGRDSAWHGRIDVRNVPDAGGIVPLSGRRIPRRTAAHSPDFTVAGAATLRGSLLGGHRKNLFLKAKRARPPEDR
jgi:hypothetical protein